MSLFNQNMDPNHVHPDYNRMNKDESILGKKKIYGHQRGSDGVSMCTVKMSGS